MSGWLNNTAIPENVDLDFGTFWPKIPTQEFYTAYRPPSELPDTVVKMQLINAGIKVTRALRSWQESQTAAKLEELQQPVINGSGELIHLFKRAVYCECKAELLRETITAAQRKEAENTAKSGNETEEKYREMSADAISLIMNEPLIYSASI